MPAPISRVGFILKPGEERATALLHEILAFLNERGIEVYADRRMTEFQKSAHLVDRAEMSQAIDLLLVLGGDGTMLAASRLLGNRRVPVIGINFGTLGYLTEVPGEHAIATLSRVIAGDFEVNTRMRLEAIVSRHGEQVASGPVLNDVVIAKSALSRIISIECHIESQFLSVYRADGLIVATPTGSTAHSLSAGGPIIHPSVEAVILSPICPHTLSNRPIVVPAGWTIELELLSRGEEVALSRDGQIGIGLRAGDQITIRRHAVPFDLVSLRDRTHFEVLRQKLGWNGSSEDGAHAADDTPAAEKTESGRVSARNTPPAGTSGQNS
jgi:NAD+ kinase